MHEPIGGVAAPATAAQATSAQSGVPCGSRANVTSALVLTATVARRTAVWPRRSTMRPTHGEVVAIAIDRPATTRPLAAYEPVSSLVRTISSRLIAAYGVRATIAMRKRRMTGRGTTARVGAGV